MYEPETALGKTILVLVQEVVTHINPQAFKRIDVGQALLEADRHGVTVNESVKAKIFEALLANHRAIIAHYKNFDPVKSGVCGCDTSVGFVCTECGLRDLMKQLNELLTLYPQPE